MPIRRILLLPLAVLLPLVVASCGSDAPPPVFTPLAYDYLRPIRLNVATLDVENHARTHGPDDVAAESPVPPGQALTQMAHDRVFPGGSGGRAVFVIEDASVQRHGDSLSGSLAVRLDVVGPDGQARGFAEARVARASTDGSGDLRSRLYALTRQMMDDMNVEFEYQVRHSLRSWLQPDADVPTGVSAQPLDGAAGARGTVQPTPMPVVPGLGASVPASGYGDGTGAAAGVASPGTLSPPPTSLALPQGYAPTVQGSPAVPASPHGAPASGAPPYGAPAGVAPSTPYPQPVPYAPPFYSPSPYSAPMGQPAPNDRGPQSGPLPLTPE